MSSILIVAPTSPYPPIWGFAKRVHRLARELAGRHRLGLLAYGDGSPSEGADIFQSMRLVPPPWRAVNKRWAQLSSVISPHSHHLGHLRASSLQEALDDMLEREHFDIVQLESSQMGFLRVPPQTVSVLDEHNIEFQLLQRLSGVDSHAYRRAFCRLEAMKVEREEAQAWRRSTGCVFTSDLDLATMRRSVPETRACVVPNGVDLQYYQPSTADPQPDTMLFVGSINYRPNSDAVAHFVRDVLPLILRARPAARLTVVGPGAPPWLVRSANGQVEFAGRVEDVRPYLERSAVVIVPIRVGSGTRLKILEAMAMAKPIVSTTVGCEGLPLTPEEHLLVADGPVCFAQAVLRVLEDPRLARCLGDAGRALAEREFGWAAAAGRLEHFYSEISERGEAFVR